MLTMIRFILFIFTKPFRRISLNTLILNLRTGAHCAVKSGSRVYDCTMGRCSYIGRHCFVNNTGIGSFCSIADSAVVGMASHPTDWVSTSPAFGKGQNPFRSHYAELPYKSVPWTKIGHDVWIGTNACIKAGVTVGNGAIIGAGAVVTGNVAPYAIVAGVPAREIRKRFDGKTIAALEALQWWNLPDDKLRSIGSLADSPERFIESCAALGKSASGG